MISCFVSMLRCVFDREIERQTKRERERFLTVCVDAVLQHKTALIFFYLNKTCCSLFGYENVQAWLINDKVVCMYIKLSLSVSVCLSVCPSFSVCLSLCLSLSLSRTHARTHIHTHTQPKRRSYSVVRTNDA